MLQEFLEENPKEARLIVNKVILAAQARHADVVRLYDLVREVGFRGFTLGTEIRPPEAGGDPSDRPDSGGER